MSAYLYLDPKKGCKFSKGPLVPLEMTSVSAVPPSGDQALGHCSDRGSWWWWSSGTPSQLRGQDPPSMLAILRTSCSCSLRALLTLQRGWHLCTGFLFLSVTPDKHCWQPELGAAVGLLPPPQPLPWHPCTGVGRDDNGPESYRNQANTEACCLLFTRLWISILWHRKSAGRKTLFLLATTRCLSQAALARALQRGKDHGWCWAEQRGDGHIFSMELCGKSDLSLLFSHILWASYLIQVKSKLLNRTVTQHAYQINEVWV